MFVCCSLCFLAQSYDLAAELISEFADVEITVGFLMQVDKLVQLLESPIFVHLRLQLLETSAPHHPALVKSLYGKHNISYISRLSIELTFIMSRNI